MATAKRVKAWKAKLTPGKQYPVEEALKLVKEFATAKFAETVDAAVNLGIDASKSDQQVRGSTVMPHGTGKTVRDRKSTRLNSSHLVISYAVFCLKKKNKQIKRLVPPAKVGPPLNWATQ